MQQVTGRLTADAVVRTTTGGKDVVSFNIADNESYKPKGKEEKVEISTFFNCSYWISTGVAQVLRKGTVVQLNGRVSARAYQSNTGDMAAALNFNASRIEVLAYAPKTDNTVPAQKADGKSTGKKNGNETEDDLPF
jgi:single-strand DNA-binding protein